MICIRVGGVNTYVLLQVIILNLVLFGLVDRFSGLGLMLNFSIF